ncbi:MAG: LapA family protein [Dehalococcoidia bacterium]
MTRDRTTTQPQEPDDRQTIGEQLRLAVGILAVGALALFILQNLQEVEIHFLWFDWSTRMLWALLASTAVGALAAWLFSALRRRARPRTDRDD